MRLSLLSFNLLAVAALVTPTMLLFYAAGPSIGPMAQLYLGAFVLGALCLFGALNQLTTRRANPASAMRLIALGGLLAGAPIVALLGVALHR